jgi:glucose dehydrogenase
MWANRNGYFYVLDRTDGKFLFGKPFVKVNWSSGLDANGRPIVTTQPAGAETFPGLAGGTNWYSPSYNPRTGMFYISAWENYRNIFQPTQQDYQQGRQFTGGRGAAPIPGVANVPTLHRGPITHVDGSDGHRRGDCGGSKDRESGMAVSHDRRH